jgi:replication-associated recombination protein RarA
MEESKKMRMRKSMEKQIDLSGKAVEEEDLSIGNESVGLIKSALQKCIRQGRVEPAMYWALKLAEGNSWSCWKRLSTIADEDVGQPDAIVAVDVLYKKFMAMKKQRKEKELSWDMKRCVVLGAKILAEASKDRRADEFLEIMDAIEKNPESELLKPAKEMFGTIPDESYDGHTKEGRVMGRGFNTKKGLLFWYEHSSETVNKTPQYEEWRSWFKPLMIEIVKAKKGKK